MPRNALDNGVECDTSSIEPVRNLGAQRNNISDVKPV